MHRAVDKGHRVLATMTLRVVNIGQTQIWGCYRARFETRANANALRQAVALYRLKVTRSLDRDTAELFYVQTDELIARGTTEEVEKVLARLLRDAAQEGTELP